MPSATANTSEWRDGAPNGVATSAQPPFTGNNATLFVERVNDSTRDTPVSVTAVTNRNSISKDRSEGSTGEHVLIDVDTTANLDPSDDTVVGPPDIIPDCEQRLERAMVTYKPAKVPLIARRNTVCGAHQTVQYVIGPTGMTFQPRPVVSCPLALGLARFEGLVQTLAVKHFGQRVKSINQGGTYSCRSMARFRMASEHSYANAIDLYGFTLANGKRISVARDFGSPKADATGVEGTFLRELARAAYDEGVFSVVATRFFDELHRDHIHVDMAHYRTDGTR